MAETENNITKDEKNASVSEQPKKISVSTPSFDTETETKAVTEKTDNKIIKRVLIAAGAVIVALVAAAGITGAVLLQSVPADRVADNVFIEDLDVSGLTYDELLSSIKATYLLENKDISITCQGKTMTIHGSDIGIGANPEETADKAFQVAKSDSSIKNAIKALQLKLKPEVIVPSAFVDDALLDQKLNEFGIEVYGELKSPSITIEGNNAVVTPGTAGYNNSPEFARGEVKWHIQYESFENIPVSLESAEPEPLTMEALDAAVYRDPVNASYKVENNSVSIVPSQNGRYLNKEEAAPLLEAGNASGESFTVPIYASQPEVLESTLQEKLFNGSLSHFSTNYSSSASGRKQNVAIAAGKLNGTVVGPGETFSFNATVGLRSEANGFQPATEYVNGESVQGIGGGVCQVSSTLFNAVLMADLDIVSRSPHSKTVSYLPYGRDAAVADYGPDFKFRNNTSYPIKISASANGSELSMTITGTAYEPAHNVSLSVTNGTTADGRTSYILYRKTTAGDQIVRDEKVCTSVYK